jgi:hypothetical protein
MNNGVRRVILKETVLYAIVRVLLQRQPSIMPAQKTVSPAMEKTRPQAISNASAPNATTRMDGQTRYSATLSREIMGEQIRDPAGPVMPRAWAVIPASLAMMLAKLTMSIATKE